MMTVTTKNTKSRLGWFLAVVIVLPGCASSGSGKNPLASLWGGSDSKIVKKSPKSSSSGSSVASKEGKKSGDSKSPGSKSGVKASVASKSSDSSGSGSKSSTKTASSSPSKSNSDSKSRTEIKSKDSNSDSVAQRDSASRRNTPESRVADRLAAARDEVRREWGKETERDEAGWGKSEERGDGLFGWRRKSSSGPVDDPFLDVADAEKPASDEWGTRDSESSGLSESARITASRERLRRALVEDRETASHHSGQRHEQSEVRMRVDSLMARALQCEQNGEFEQATHHARLAVDLCRHSEVEFAPDEDRPHEILDRLVAATAGEKPARKSQWLDDDTVLANTKPQVTPRSVSERSSWWEASGHDRQPDSMTSTATSRSRQNSVRVPEVSDSAPWPHTIAVNSPHETHEVQMSANRVQMPNNRSLAVDPVAAVASAKNQVVPAIELGFSDRVDELPSEKTTVLPVNPEPEIPAKSALDEIQFASIAPLRSSSGTTRGSTQEDAPLPPLSDLPKIRAPTFANNLDNLDFEETFADSEVPIPSVQASPIDVRWLAGLGGATMVFVGSAFVAGRRAARRQA